MSIDICKELHQNAIDFAYEANSQRAFADARDGLKPGQRACLWEMYSKGYASNKPHVKSAKIDGGVAASWWPHGTTAIYETFARMSQPWINNIPEVDWHGANGNQIIGSVPAADRYTEARLAKATEEGMLQGLKKRNVPMILNFSEDEEWPEVLPAIIPRLMINGCQGIGYTVANTWVPHNLKELTDIIKNYILTNEIDYKQVYPDFPSGGIIINRDELPTIYSTGKGRIVLRGKVDMVDNSTIHITELPYQVYVEPLLDEIKDLIMKDELTGIDEIYNKCDKKRLLIEIKCSGSPKVLLNELYKKTSLQKTYNPNQYALVSKTPKLLNLKQYLDIYIEHNLQCIKREYEYDLEKAKARLEIVEGLVKALEDIDNIIELIKKSESSAKAKDALIQKYEFTDNQAKAILDMRLSKLAHLEKVELNNELMELTSNIKTFSEIIRFREKQTDIFAERLTNFTTKHGKDRKTEVIQVATASKEEKEIEFVEPEKCVVVLTESGLVKRVPTSSFRNQRRNGKGVKTQDDITQAVIRTNTIDSLMIFTDKGKMYRLLVNDIPVGTNSSKGQAVKGLVEMEPHENPSVIYSIYRDTDAKYVLFTTKNGLVKKTSLEEYVKTKKKSGIVAISLKEDDELVSVNLIKDEPVVIVSADGMSIKFNSTEIGATSRATAGVKGITLKPDDKVVSTLVVRNDNDTVALFSENGLGKRFSINELPIQKRAGKGLMGYKPNDSTGRIACAALLSDDDSVLICGDKTGICLSATEIPILGRASAGNQLIKGNKVLSVSKV
jgi:DNA gyrase subunit A